MSKLRKRKRNIVVLLRDRQRSKFTTDGKLELENMNEEVLNTEILACTRIKT